MATNKTILLKGDPLRKEREAGGAITPGDLIKVGSDGKVVVHATAGGNAQRAFAIENDLAGEEIGDAYASGERVQYLVCRRGDEVMARLKASENVVVGDFLESAGDGTLQKHVVESSGAIYVEQIVGMVLEASNVGTVARVAIEIV